MAAAVTDTDQDTAFDILSALVERSLVVSNGDDRFRQLDTLREVLAIIAASLLIQTANDSVPPIDGWPIGCRKLTTACDPYSHGPLPDRWPRLRVLKRPTSAQHWIGPSIRTATPESVLVSSVPSPVH